MTDLNQYGIGFTIEGTLLASSIARSHALQHSERMRSILMGRIGVKSKKTAPLGISSYVSIAIRLHIRGSN